eukprot:CAMPEP_0196731308 /NCGR_PEP_ID=MMETSP1091-20130531/11101_1 /TAXON_ID=302021 /ORGANISM="Rhodomonas sp., Strain CCMP768" /LENGTH=483 /DNA_ID=CAMNT_0042074437 /DNA_START=8 /DNA_END=1459 /DNA_ORIENTATION=-
MVEVRSYGALPSNGSRPASSGSKNLRTVAYALSAVAAMAVVAVVAMTASASPNALLDKQQAAWWGVPHKDGNGNWDEGWLHKYVNGGRGRAPARTQQKSAVAGGQQQEIDEIHSLLNKAVHLLGDVESKKGQSKSSLYDFPVVGGPNAPPGDYKDPTELQEPSDYPNKASADRMARYHTDIREDLPACFYNNDFSDAEKQHAIRRMSEAADHLAMTFPDWAKSETIMGAGQDGEWRHDRGPPYVQRLTMFAGDGVDSLHNGNLVRRILGLKTAFGKNCDLRSCDHAWTGNSYLRSFDGSQFRFLYRNQCSAIVIPPLTKGAGPILSQNGLFRLHHYLKDGYNTMVVTGGTASLLFLNQNIATLDGGFDLEPAWVDGPFEAQAAQGANTPFAALSTSLPGPGVAVTGAKISSLPANAISYYEAEDVSVLFEIPMGTGRIIYLGYDFSEPVVPWVHALIASTMFNDYDFDGPVPDHVGGSVYRND